MLAESYAKAMYEVIEGGVSTPKAFERLDAVLVRRGHQKLKGPIVRTLSRYAKQKAVSDAPVVTVAIESSVKQFAKEIANAQKSFDATGEPTVFTDERQVGGFTFQYKGKYLDRSYKGKLVKLYRNITTSLIT